MPLQLLGLLVAVPCGLVGLEAAFAVFPETDPLAMAALEVCPGAQGLKLEGELDAYAAVAGGLSPRYLREFLDGVQAASRCLPGRRFLVSLEGLDGSKATAEALAGQWVRRDPLVSRLLSCSPEPVLPDLSRREGELRAFSIEAPDEPIAAALKAGLEKQGISPPGAARREGARVSWSAPPDRLLELARLQLDHGAELIPSGARLVVRLAGKLSTRAWTIRGPAECAALQAQLAELDTWEAEQGEHPIDQLIERARRAGAQLEQVHYLRERESPWEVRLRIGDAQRAAILAAVGSPRPGVQIQGRALLIELGPGGWGPFRWNLRDELQGALLQGCELAEERREYGPVRALSRRERWVCTSPLPPRERLEPAGFQAIPGGWGKLLRRATDVVELRLAPINGGAELSLSVLER